MTRDLDYEENNIIYDKTNGIKCKNYELYQDTVLPTAYEGYIKYLCITCGDGFKWNELEFRKTNEEYVIRKKTNIKQVK